MPDLGRKVGPLPMWAWLAGGGVVAVGGLVIYRRRKAETSAANAAGTANSSTAGTDTTDTSDDGTTTGAAVAPGTASYYYDTGAQTTAAAPNGTLTQSQSAAQKRLNTDVTALEKAYYASGVWTSALNDAKTAKEKTAYQKNASSATTAIGKANTQIQSDILALSAPAAAS